MYCIIDSLQNEVTINVSQVVMTPTIGTAPSQHHGKEI